MGTTHGSKDPNSRALGLKYHYYYVLYLGPKPYHLGPWIRRDISS